MKKPHMTISGRRAMTGRLFVLPFYIGFALFFLKPAVESLTFAFSDVTIKRGGFDVVFSGLKNLRYIFQTDPDFTKNLVASLTSLLYTVPVVIIASLFFAIVLNAKFHGRTVVRAIFFLPVIIASGVVMEIINSDTFASGLISSSQGMDAAVSASSYGLTELLIQMGLSEDIVSYFSYISSNLYDLMWRTGIQMIIFLAALQSISPALYEASAIEGASAWENFWMITIPMIAPMILVNIVYTIIDTFTDSANAVMDQITTVFRDQQYSRAAAMSWVYFLIIGVILGVVLFISARSGRSKSR
ncbi:MAG: carbohydrate ABC transporter permease [Acutalibacteraceae bacterium]|mgnify:CR=1 FL=1|nr:sugar ABC transporter permease [Clostridiales bacterium]